MTMTTVLLTRIEYPKRREASSTNNNREENMITEKEKLDAIENMVLDEWTTSDFISAISDYGIDLDLRASHVEALCKAILKDREDN